MQASHQQKDGKISYASIAKAENALLGPEPETTLDALLESAFRRHLSLCSRQLYVATQFREELILQNVVLLQLVLWQIDANIDILRKNDFF